jgi:hypothetical protein
MQIRHRSQRRVADMNLFQMADCQNALKHNRKLSRKDRAKMPVNGHSDI